MVKLHKPVARETTTSTTTTTYDNKFSGGALIIIYGQGILFELALKVSLSSHNWANMEGIMIYYGSKNLTQVRLLHGTYIPEAGVTIYFELRGMMLYYNTRPLKEKELMSCHHMIMTSE